MYVIFTFSSRHIKKQKHMKLVLLYHIELNISKMLSFQYFESTNNEIFYIFYTKSSKSCLHFIHFKLTQFQVLNIHMWLRY